MRPLLVLAICLALVLSISAQAKNNGGGLKSPPTKTAETKIKGKVVTEQKASKKSGNTGKGPNNDPSASGASAGKGPNNNNPNASGASAGKGPNNNPNASGASAGKGPKLTPDKTGVKNISQ